METMICFPHIDSIDRSEPWETLSLVLPVSPPSFPLAVTKGVAAQTRPPMPGAPSAVPVSLATAEQSAARVGKLEKAAQFDVDHP